MGHRLLSHDRANRALQQRLDENVTGAPTRPALRKILRLLLTPQDADLARGLPTRVERLAARLGFDAEDLILRLTRLAQWGLAEPPRIGPARRRCWRRQP